MTCPCPPEFEILMAKLKSDAPWTRKEDREMLRCEELIRSCPLHWPDDPREAE